MSQSPTSGVLSEVRGQGTLRGSGVHGSVQGFRVKGPVKVSGSDAPFFRYAK